jgi:hypothetical protein
MQEAGWPIHTEPHVGRLSGQAKPAPHNTNSKNLLEHRPPQWQEHPGTNENAMEAPTDLYEPTFSSLGPTGHVNLLLNVKVARP